MAALAAIRASARKSACSPSALHLLVDDRDDGGLCELPLTKLLERRGFIQLDRLGFDAGRGVMPRQWRIEIHRTAINVKGRQHALFFQRDSFELVANGIRRTASARQFNGQAVQPDGNGFRFLRIKRIAL